MASPELIDRYAQRTEYLLQSLQGHQNDGAKVEEVYLGLQNLFESLYGTGSPQFNILRGLDSRLKSSDKHYDYPFSLWRALIGVAANLKNELSEGLVVNLYRSATGSTVGDFLSSARNALDDGIKDVAAVLISAAYEDSMRQKAEELGLDVEKKDVEGIFNALKSASFLQGTEAKAAESHIRLRNWAMHAN